MKNYKLKKKSEIRQKDLYFLEKYFGPSSGHGQGFGGEDIDWTISRNHNYSDYKVLWITRREDSLDIHYKHFNDSIGQFLPLSSLPEPWLSALKKVLDEHAVNKKIPTTVKRQKSLPWMETGKREQH